MSEIIHITLENGNLLEFDALHDDDSDLAANTDSALVGNYGLAVLIDDQAAVYGAIYIGGGLMTSDDLSFRLYLDPNNLTIPTGNDFTIVYTDPLIFQLSLKNNSGTFQLIAYAIDDDSNWQSMGSSNITDEPHCIEFRFKRATGIDGNNGEAQWWIDEVSKSSLDTLDLYNNFTWEDIHVGAVASIDADTSGTFYLDDFIVRDDGVYIGLASADLSINIALDNATYQGTGVRVTP